MEPEEPISRPSPETIQDPGYSTPEAIALAQAVDNIDKRIFEKWKVEDETTT